MPKTTPDISRTEGLFSGYVARADELVELKNANESNIRGLKSLG